MSKKMWNKIFKSKSSKSAKIPASVSSNTDINYKRCSIYEEYQQLNGLVNSEKSAHNLKKFKENKPQTNENIIAAVTAVKNDQTKNDVIAPSIAIVAGNTFLQSVETVPGSNPKQQSTFAKVVNTLTLKRSTQQQKDSKSSKARGNGNNSSNCNENGSATLKKNKTKERSTSKNNKKSESTNIATVPPPLHASTHSLISTCSRRSSQYIIVVSKIVCDAPNAFNDDSNVAAYTKVAVNDIAKHARSPVTCCNVANLTNTNKCLHVSKQNIKITEPTEQPDPDTSDELFPCPICNRTFHPLIFEKHASICERTAKKKRQPFDSKRQRTEGTDLANYNPPRLPGARVSHTLLSPRLTTRKQLQNTESPTVTTIASAAPKVSRNISTTSASGSSSNTPLYQRSVSESSKRPMIPPEEHCPYCGRTFCRKAFDTHVGYCKTKLLRDANKPVDPSKEVLRERMEMRQKFVPPLLKSKRYLNRVKYSAAEAVEAREAAKNQSKNESTISVVDKELNSKTPLAKHHDSYNESVNNNNIASLNSTNSRKTTNDGNSLITSNDKIGIMSLSMTSSLTSNSGLPDYDPFLSAKRQLEELYSPTGITETFDTAMSNITNMSDSTPQPTSSTPSTPSISIPTQSKMSTSLTLSTSTPNSSPISTAMNNNQKRTSKCTTPNISNFRRSSSLRGPRRTPTLPPRPLFSYNYRPTIQRGLSDEGPISTNFLKSEEYDEMPVRSNCVNDFAITNSPRVVRRDTSASNRKHNLKLNINAANLSAENSSDDRLSSASKYISKTDSLAVFLKYENELEKLNAAAAATAAAKTTTTLPNKTPDIAKLSTQQSCTDSTSAQNIQPSSPVITKELKDKSNILSKQNSVKSIKVDSKNTSNDAKPESQKTKTHLPTPVGILPSNNSTKSLLSKKVNDNISQKNNNNKLSQIRLEPISKPATPLTKPHTPKTKPNTPLISQNSTNMLTQLPAVNKPINLNEIFGEPKIKAKSICKDRKISNSSEYIDPKLINKCDNLPVNFSDICSYKHFDSDSSTQRTDSSASSTSGNAPISQLTKALPLAKIDSTKGITALKSTAPIAIQSTSSTPNALSNQRNSIDARTGQLKRKMRLGLNHFLYDASPEADDSCLADDEANRSSTEYSNQQKQHQSRRNFTPRSNAEQQKDLPTNLTPLPIFDDFDFEEFLSSFENDEEQFPLFKDCREFLMNRTSKQRSTLTPNSYTNNNNNSSNKNSNSNSNSNSDSNRTLTQEPSTKPNNNIFNSNMNSPFLTQTQHFQFPTLLAKTNNISSQHLLTCTPSLKTNSNDDKREIFISIETEQNEMGRSSISPDTIRNMMGHNQSVVEIEVDPPDNKFSKISDDESLPIGSLGQLPNVQFNNAKNLMQKMQENFRQRSEEVSTGVRQAYNHNATPGNSGERRANSHISGDTYNDSDEMSSLDNYPLPRQTRRGAGTKLSADSAYGSLSRQRSSELTNQHQTLSHTRSPNTKASSNNPSNTTLVDGASHAMPQHHHRYSTSKTRARQFSGSSSSESNNSLPPIGHNNNNNNNNNKTALRVNCNNNYQQQQDHQEQYYYNAADNNNNNNNIGSGSGNGNDNMRLYNKSTTNGNFESPLSSPMATSSISATQNPSYQQPEATSPGTQNAMLNPHHSNSSLSSSSNMSSSMKMSKFCHECGTKFIIEQAKFCMDCGVRRIVL
ncbi:putative uncharacterized protein DDB_G0282133 isoform X2 [Teleopsis dalmanni]|uniref:putative uncharacterized protein DDB_G0282133 isoform X2 n=1 Tax=Teleopsis dalmanni TaxID=139649 RepID=UPI0018CE4FE8|nr:putative uncharacterized protein DDB_G0282133 isoform X2 [Teleopsis dalmanni]